MDSRYKKRDGRADRRQSHRLRNGAERGGAGLGELSGYLAEAGDEELKSVVRDALALLPNGLA